MKSEPNDEVTAIADVAHITGVKRAGRSVWITPDSASMSAKVWGTL